MNDTVAETQTEVAQQGELLEASVEADVLPKSRDPKELPLVSRSAEQRSEPITSAGISAPHPLQILSDALASGVDIDKLERLMDMADRYEEKIAEKAFNAALAAFQAECPRIAKDKLATVHMKSGGTYTYSYADLDQIMSKARPILGKHGLSVSFDVEVSQGGGKIKSLCYVKHAAGYTNVTEFIVPLDEEMKVNDSQKMGSANSYANRYNVCNALGITTGEDDDAGALHGDGSRSSATGASSKADNLDEFFPIGKHKGKPWDQVPLDYLEWAVANLDSKPEVVERCKKQIEMRSESQQPAPADDGEPTMAECARAITNAKSLEDLQKTRSVMPDKHWTGLQKFYEQRTRELGGGTEDFDDDIPF